MDATKFRALVDSMAFEQEKCWEWIGRRTKDGYTKVYFEGKQIGAHRASHMTFKGPIPDGLTIDHLCRNRACINPLHLEAVTIRENVLRGECAAARNLRKTHCKRGHEMDFDENLGHRRCKTCARMRRLVGFIPKKPDGRPGAHKKEACKNGHQYDGTEIVYRGARVCRACSRNKTAAYLAKRKVST